MVTLGYHESQPVDGVHDAQHWIIVDLGPLFLEFRSCFQLPEYDSSKM